MNTYIGLDLGTSVIKGLVMQADGKVLATAAKNVSFVSRKSSWVEQSPEIWWSTILEILQILSVKADMKAVCGIGISGQMHGLVTYDSHRSVLRRAIVWLDKRSQKEVETILQKFHKGKLYNITGNPLFSGFLLPSLLWIKNNEPEVYEKITIISSPKDYLAYRFTGVLRTEPTDALATAAFDYKKKEWSNTIITGLGLKKEIFPKVEATTAPYGGLTAKVAKMIGLREGIPIFGGSDQSMAAMGSGLVQKGDAMIALSTGGQFLVVDNKGLIDKKNRLHTLNHALDNIGLYMAATLSAGLSLKWFKNNILDEESVDYSEVIKNIETIPLGSGGIYFLPFLAGERTPYFNPNLKGSFIGLSVTHTKLHVMRAIMEGVAYSMKECLNVFQEMSMPLKRVVLSGGGAKNSLWREIITDVLGIPTEVITVQDHSPFGAAIFAKFAQEGFDKLPEFYKNVVKPVNFLQPHEKHTEAYNKLFQEYKKFASYMNSYYKPS